MSQTVRINTLIVSSYKPQYKDPERREKNSNYNGERERGVDERKEAKTSLNTCSKANLRRTH